jgi:molybdate transport system substrate-binding protein
LTELNVFSSIGVQSAVEKLVPHLEEASGHRLVMTWATAPMLVRRIEAGETPDAVILSRASIDALAGAGRLAAGSAVPVASSAVAIAVKAGAPRPDISTAEALKRALLGCKCIAYTEPAAGGASGIHFAKLLERMGIAEAMQAKTKYPPAGGFSASLLLTGEVDLAVQQQPELMHVDGTEIIGLLPDELNVVTQFLAAVAADTVKAEAAARMIALLRSATAVAMFRIKGLDPAA